MHQVNMSCKTFEAWVRALCSGTYIQGFKGKLCMLNANGDWEYCPLGVLADVEGMFSHEENTVQGMCQVVYEPDRDVYLSGYLPQHILPKDLQDQIMELCDAPPRGEGKSFTVVGSWLEGNVQPAGG